ncbi:hypothetical protein BDP27DRAFT_1324239 [Rhodocollybia butyracea]|uniref:Uncharacterized protein n=1 Tax=Rhodocollybia butyracea TaxID=206335 RepID=A0A9P5U9I8_9AGAR|nr:hypothetical protein BDP27DRAFT_1324239 [Rhodocollybia butyracea]
MLKVARLHGFALHFSRPVFLSGLTCLKLDCTGNLPLRYIDLKALLTECYSLEYFSIRGEIVDAPPWPDYAPILLPKLLSLHVFSLYGQVYSGVLLIVDSPLLQSLDLEDAHDSDLDTFFRTPHELPSLRSFSLSGTSYFTPSKLNRVYALFPSLNEISLPDFVFNPPAILKAVSESMQDLRPYATSQRTLGLMLNPTQRSSLKHMLEGRLENDADILELFGYGWTFTNFFDWLQNFVTDEIL